MSLLLSAFACTPRRSSVQLGPFGPSIFSVVGSTSLLDCYQQSGSTQLYRVGALFPLRDGFYWRVLPPSNFSGCATKTFLQSIHWPETQLYLGSSPAFAASPDAFHLSAISDLQVYEHPILISMSAVSSDASSLRPSLRCPGFWMPRCLSTPTPF